MKNQKIARAVAWRLLVVVLVVLASTSAVLQRDATAMASTAEIQEPLPSVATEVAANETLLFSGGYYDDQLLERWTPRFGTFAGSSTVLSMVTGTSVPSPVDTVHAEAQLNSLLGADFTYAADLVVDSSVNIHLQFRISDEGRYSLQLRPDSAVFYRFGREQKACDLKSTSTIAHCPDWPDPITCQTNCDPPQWVVVAQQPLGLASGTRHHLVIVAQGEQFRVSLDGTALFAGIVTDGFFGVGRFGVYVLGPAAALPNAEFSNIRISTDPTRAANFALLYSTAGYEAAGTKRALVRTLNDLPSDILHAAQATGTAVDQSHFTLKRDDGTVVKEGPLVALTAPDGGQPDGASIYLPLVAGGTAPRVASTWPARLLSPASDNGIDGAKTFGMQLWEADFSSVTIEGTYTLHIDFTTTAGTNHLQTAPFEIRTGLVTNRMLKPLSILNAQARRAADDDLRRNWQKSSSAWSVSVDGAFLADQADAENGALLTRIFDDNNWPLYATNFRYVGEITIISGCDAQMQFRITDTERWAVTLQAGDGGGCAFGGGPGAVRLHHEGPQGFDVLASQLFPLDAPLQAGHPYRVEILAVDDAVTVWVDGVPPLFSIPVPARHGRFALKAWGATVRFNRVQAWEPTVPFLTRTDPQWQRVPIPTFANWNDATHQASTLIACQSFTTTAGGVVLHDPVDGEAYHQACNPLFPQYHGLHDANNIIGEASSHGAFLAGLMQVWKVRAHTFSMADREALRQAIQTTALYLEELYQEGSAPGEFAHSEMGRGGVNTNLGPWQSELALYGMSAFADGGAIVDKGLARLACERAIDGARWLETQGYLQGAAARSVIFTRIARCAEREKLSQCDQACQQADTDKATAAADALLTQLATPGGLGRAGRDTGRIIPWFEGVYELIQSDSTLQAAYQDRLNAIATLLVTHLTQEHPCDDAQPAGARCAANGFYVLPQANNDSPIPLTNWVQMDQVPMVDQLTQVPYVYFYNAGHFAIAAVDAVYLGLMTGRTNLEPVATGNLYWILGLNPGIPASKAVLRGSGDDRPWQAAAFVYNLDAPFARTIEGYRTEASSAKGWKAPWEREISSPHRESWWVDPLDNGFQSIVNGHVLWDGQWDYWNTGQYGWASGETFILYDGLFLQAATLLEDWMTPGAPVPANPYDTTQLTFFDTTHIDRAGTGWGFDDPNWSEAAQAARAATEFCTGKGFGGGRFTGHQIGERVGVLCVAATAAFFDASTDDIAATDWDFQDINQTHWAQVPRAATGFCNLRGFVGGFFTGHQLNGLRGITCLDSSAAQWFDATEQELYNSGQGFDDINTLSWAKGARGATNICLGKGFPGGFMTGHRIPGNVGVVCLLE